MYSLHYTSQSLCTQDLIGWREKETENIMWVRLHSPTHLYREGIGLPDLGKLCDVFFVLCIATREEGALQTPEQLPKPRHIEHRPLGKGTDTLYIEKRYSFYLAIIPLWHNYQVSVSNTMAVSCPLLLRSLQALGFRYCERKFALWIHRSNSMWFSDPCSIAYSTWWYPSFG